MIKEVRYRVRNRGEELSQEEKQSTLLWRYMKKTGMGRLNIEEERRKNKRGGVGKGN